MKITRCSQDQIHVTIAEAKRGCCCTWNRVFAVEVTIKTEGKIVHRVAMNFFERIWTAFVKLFCVDRIKNKFNKSPLKFLKEVPPSISPDKNNGFGPTKKSEATLKTPTPPDEPIVGGHRTLPSQPEKPTHMSVGESKEPTDELVNFDSVPDSDELINFDPVPDSDELVNFDSALNTDGSASISDKSVNSDSLPNEGNPASDSSKTDELTKTRPCVLM